MINVLCCNCHALKYFTEDTESTTRTQVEWDKHWLAVCNYIAKQSNCFSRKIGCILIRNDIVVSYGWNNTPDGVPPCDQRILLDKELATIAFEKGIVDTKFENRCPRQVLGFKSGEGLKWCVAGHGERNALINAAKNGICTKGTKMYMNCGIPCTPCLVEIINAGVEEIIVTSADTYDISAKYLLEQSKLKWRVYNDC